MSSRSKRKKIRSEGSADYPGGQRRRKPQSRHVDDDGEVSELAEPEEEEDEAPDFDEDTVISTVASLPLEGKLAYLLSVDTQLREKNDDLDYKSEKSQWKLKQFKKELFQQKHGAALVEQLELNEKLRAQQVDLLDTLTTLNSRAVMCVNCLHRLEEEVVEELRDPVLDMTDRVRAEAEGTLPAAQPSGGAGAGSKPPTAGGGGSGASNGPAPTADGVAARLAVSPEGHEHLTVTIGEGDERALRGALRDALAQHTHARHKTPTKPRSFSVATLGRKMFRLKPLSGGAGGSGSSGSKGRRRVRFIGDDPSLPLIEYTPRLDPGDDAAEKASDRAAAERQLAGVGAQDPADKGEGEFACKTCGKRYKTDLELRAHFKIRHETPYLCGVCGRAYSSDIELSTHEKLRHSATPFACSVCGNSYATKLQLTSHVELRHPDVDPKAMVAEIQRVAVAGTLARRPRAATAETSQQMAASAAAAAGGAGGSGGSHTGPSPAAASAVARFQAQDRQARRRRGSTTGVMPDELAEDRQRELSGAPPPVVVVPPPPSSSPPPSSAPAAAPPEGRRSRSRTGSATAATLVRPVESGARRSRSSSATASNLQAIDRARSGSSSPSPLSGGVADRPVRRSRRSTDSVPLDPNYVSRTTGLGPLPEGLTAKKSSSTGTPQTLSVSSATERRQRRLSASYAAGSATAGDTATVTSREERRARRRSVEVPRSTAEPAATSSRPEPLDSSSTAKRRSLSEAGDGRRLNTTEQTSRGDRAKSPRSRSPRDRPSTGSVSPPPPPAAAAEVVTAAGEGTSGAPSSSLSAASSTDQETHVAKATLKSPRREKSSGSKADKKAAAKATSGGSGKKERPTGNNRDALPSGGKKEKADNKKDKKGASKADKKRSERERREEKEKREKKKEKKAAATAAAAVAAASEEPSTGLAPPSVPPEPETSPRLPPRSK